ncbi:MAG: hypothetical protein OHK0045_22540 [Raineya sp.]
MNKVFAIFAFLLLVFLLFLWQIPVLSLQNWLISTYQLDPVQAQKLKENLLNSNSWLFLRIFGSVLLALMLWLLFLLQTQIKTISYQAQSQFKTFLKPFQKLSNIEKITLIFALCLLNGYTLYNLHHKIPHIDEAFSYVHFASKGFLVSALYYPNPNNHIFYNLNVAFWDMFVLNKLWAMRLPSFLSFLALQFFLFRFFLQNFSFANALLSVLIFALLSPVQAYAMMGRGYVLQMLFLWLSIHFLAKIIQEKPMKVDVLGFILASWAAFYTIPTHLYYFVSLAILALLRNLPNFSKIYFLGKVHLAVLILAGLSYLPVFLLNGRANLFSESWQKVARQAFQEKKYEYILTFGDFWVGLENKHWIFWGLIITSFLFLWLKFLRKTSLPSPQLTFFLIYTPFCVFLIMFLQQTLIPERVWTGLALSWVVIIVLAIHSLKKCASVALILLVLAEIFVQFYQKNEIIENEYTNFAKVYPVMPLLKGEKVLSNDLVYQNLLSFYNLQDQKGLEIDYSYKAKDYQWIILTKNTYSKPPKGYWLWQETPFVMIFSK